jgi:hypothetical protein
MAKVDLEARLLQIADVVRNNLNTKIAAINSEKSGEATDAVTVPTLNTAAFEYQDFGMSTSFNYPVMVFFNIFSDLGPTVGSEVEETGRMVVELITSDRGYAGSVKILKLLARYRRALREVLLDDWQALRGISVQNLVGGRFADPNGCNFYSVGVMVEFKHAS